MGSPGVYDLQRSRMAFYQDAYWGGEQWRNPSSPTLGRASLYVYRHDRESDVITEELAATERSYLIPHAGERLSAFRARHNLASYLNFISPIVDAYADSATGKVSRDLGALAPYLRNLNGRGRTWDQHMGEVGRWTGVYGFTATLLDTPRVNPAVNRAQEESLGVGARAILIHPPAIAWVSVNDDGQVVEFAFVDQPYESDMSILSHRDVHLWVYDTQGWTKRLARADVTRGYSEQRDELTQGEILDQGAHSTPGRVPVVFTFFREVTSSKFPLGASLIADAADIAREVYNTLSNVGDIHRKTAFPFLAIPQKSATGSLEPETKVQVGPDQAMGYPSETGAPSWVQPSAEQTRELRDHAVFLIGAAYRMAGLEVSTEGTSDVQSGLAIQLKSRGFEARCARFASNLNEYEHVCLDLLAGILGTPADYSVSYPKRYVLPDAGEDLARAVMVLQTLDTKLGPQAEVAAIRQALDAALSLSDDELEGIVTEIEGKFAQAHTPAAIEMSTDPMPPVPGSEPAGGDGMAVAPEQAKDADAALNGAQVSSLLEIVTAVASGALPRDTGVGLILAAFPLTDEQVERIMGSVGLGFVPTAEPPAPAGPPPSAFG